MWQPAACQGYAVTELALLRSARRRLFRRCCMCCCMKESCATKRGAADPKQVLSGWGYWITKVRGSIESRLQEQETGHVVVWAAECWLLGRCPRQPSSESCHHPSYR